MTFSNHPIERRQKGTILVLVVALLALLAVIGTVYIVSARTEKAAALAASTSVNLKWAQLSVMNIASDVIGNSTIDSSGVVAGYNFTATPGNYAARTYDINENNGVSLTPGVFNPAIGNPNVKAEPWLVVNMHNQAVTATDCSYLTASPFNPSTGTYDSSINWNLGFNVVNDQTATDTSTDDPPRGFNDAVINLLPNNDGSGTRYRFGVRILDLNRMANLNTGATDDTKAIADTFGTNITSLRLAPPTGVLPATAAYFNAADNPNATNLHYIANTGIGRAGLSTTYNTFAVDTWQKAMMRLERPTDQALSYFDLSDAIELLTYGEFGTPYHIRPAMATSSPSYILWPYTLSAEGNAGPFPNTPSSTVNGNPPRRNYTTYSWSRELRSDPDPTSFTPYSLTSNPAGSVPGGWTGFGSPAALSTVWPTLPARVPANINPNAGATDQDFAFYLALAATNMATAMRDAGYSQDECAAFAANYVAYRTDAYAQDVNANNAYYLPYGPSFVDSQGICVRSIPIANPAPVRDFGPATIPGKTDISNGKIYLGWTAQPFINEVAAIAHKVTTIDPITGQPVTTTVVTDSAIELFNPYGLALSLKDYAIQLNGGTLIPLTGKYIPANGYFVLHASSGLPINAAAQQLTSPSFLFTDTASKVVLYRKYFVRGCNPPLSLITAWAPVDYTNCTDSASAYLIPPVTDAALGTTDTTFSIERKSGGTSSPWGAVFNVSDVRSGIPTLGVINNATGNLSFKLFDRSAERTYTTYAQVRAPFENIAQFNHLMRMGHQFTDMNNYQTLGDLMFAAVNSPAVPYSSIKALLPGTLHFANEYIEAQMHFDFYADPLVYKTTPPSDATNVTDIKAIRLLDRLAFIDRVTDASLSLLSNGGGLDIGKLRLPGQININTASGDVLRAMPNMTDQMVASILAYRKRNPVTGGTTSTATYGLSGASSTFNNTDTVYTGHGIRSLAEALFAIRMGNSSLTTPQTLDDRDAAWASIYNLCTVRSDTFAVYGYIEAVKANPRYLAIPTNSHDNAGDWYTGSTTDDPTVATAKNLRVARLRWVSIVDRSNCNYGPSDPNFQIPKVVAIKDLPR